MGMQVGAFDPVQAIIDSLMDSARMAALFKKSDAIPPEEFLRALKTAHDTAKAVLDMSFVSLISGVRDKIPDEALERHMAEIEAEDNQPDEVRMERQQHLLKRVVQFIDVPDGENPMDSIARLKDEMGVGMDLGNAAASPEAAAMLSDSFTAGDTAADGPNDSAKAKLAEAEAEFFRQLGIEPPNLGA